MKVYLENLGCAKNQVDSELMLGRLAKAGYAHCEEPESAEVIIVNTCAFIEAAVNEAIDTILELAAFKTGGCCKRLIVCGCLPERFREQLAESLPEVDFFFGTGAFDRLPAALDESTGVLPRCNLPPPVTARPQHHADPRICHPAHTVYIKIAEGCDRRCTYCIIPRLRGRQKSRPLDDIVVEARQLVKAGAKELILVAQETTAYGRDLSPPQSLSFLLEQISALSDRIRIRVMYMHPDSLDSRTITIMGERDNICSYFDIPIQHAADPVLKRMGRGHSSAHLEQLLELIRKTIPEAALRTTVMVGFPGETDNDADQLADFMGKIRFDHLGAFVYSDAADILSHRLDGHVPPAVAESRRDRIMTAQAEISRKINQTRVDKVFDVLVENEIESGLLEGRTWFQAPEVDGVTFVHCRRNQPPGDLVPVRIMDATEYDLTGETL